MKVVDVITLVSAALCALMYFFVYQRRKNGGDSVAYQKDDRRVRRPYQPASYQNVRRPAPARPVSRSRGRAQTQQDGFSRLGEWVRPVKGDIDYPFLMEVGLIMAFGLNVLFSAGSARAFSNFGDSLWYFKKQIGGVVVGTVGMFILSKFDYHRLG